MRAHELARKLLEGPDLPVITAHGGMEELTEIVIIVPWPPPEREYRQRGWFAHLGDEWPQSFDPAIEIS